MSDQDNTGYQLVVSFEDQSPAYCHGFEAGQLWARMNSGAEAEITATVVVSNRETISRMAVARGWDAVFEECGADDWLTFILTKTKAAIARPNPMGLRIVKDADP